ncbi:Peptidase, M50 family [Devosia sp. LC5]|nr:Peptidase, M50 family [Devosia sp. LC5]
MGEIVSRIAAVLLYAAIQGFALAGFARLLGDKRPQYEGRLTANPFAHISVWGTVMAALFAMSWVRAVRLDPAQNRLGHWGLILVALLALGVIVALVPLIDLLRPLALLLPRTGGYAMLYVAGQLQIVAIASVALNLLPIPGLIGGVLWQAIWPGEERRLLRLEPFGLAMVIVAIVAGWLPNLANVLLPLVQLR